MYRRAEKAGQYRRLIMIKKSRLITLLLMFLCLNGCGYHLRGDVSLPEALQHAYLEGASIPLREQFAKLLSRDAGHLVNVPEQSGVIISITNEHASERVLSLNARGRSNELELYYQIKFTLYRADHTELAPSQSLEIKREYFNNQQEIIAKDNEEAVIRKEMLQQAARIILERARILLAAKPD